MNSFFRYMPENEYFSLKWGIGEPIEKQHRTHPVELTNKYLQKPTKFTNQTRINPLKINHLSIYFFLIGMFTGQCRTGKIMHYNPSTGKRIKDETIPGRINRLHTTLKRLHQLPKDWHPSKAARS